MAQTTDLRKFVEQVAKGEISSKTQKEFDELQAKAKKILAAKPKKTTKTKTKAKTKATTKKDKQILLRNTKDRKDSNDKLSQIFFKPDLSQTKWSGVDLFNGKIKNSKVKNEILWKFDKDFLDANPRLLDFTAFDKEVILACISEHVTHLENKDYESSYTTTLESIYRAMVGDNGEDNRKHPSPAILEKIKESIYKAKSCNLSIDLTESCKKYGYNDGKPLKLESYILPCEFLDGYIVNGKPTTVIKFFKVSALYQSAEVQNGQILNYDKKLLAIPDVNNNDDVIVLKGYLLRRVLEIMAHKQMKNTILLNTVFHDTGFIDITQKKREQLLKHIEKFFEYWLSEKRLKSYFFVDRKGNELKGAKWQKGEIYRPTPKKANLGIHAIKFT